MAETKLLLGGLAAVVAAGLLATRSRAGLRRPGQGPWRLGPTQEVPPCSRWLPACEGREIAGQCYVLTPAVVAAAKKIRAMDEAAGNVWPLGTTRFYQVIDGKLYALRVELHGANEHNPEPHRGVGVTACADPSGAW